MKIDERLVEKTKKHPYPLLFVTISGAHLYGFPSRNSDYDLRGVHVLPVHEVIGLEQGMDTYELSETTDGLQMDIVTHDIKKFFLLLLKKNGYVLEQLYSPLIVHGTPEHEELKKIAKKCITRRHSHHYLGFSETQWKLFEKEHPPKVKPLLYVYRVLLTGIYLMRSGEIEANLIKLNEEFKLSYIYDLVQQKTSGKEKSKLKSEDIVFHEKEYKRLRDELEKAAKNTFLPDVPSGKEALSDLLLRLRKVNK